MADKSASLAAPARVQPAAAAWAVVAGYTGNDANHISAPSRTGEELGMAIRKTMSMAGFVPDDIDLISAHGTATSYNDEMEAKAIALAGLESVPQGLG